MPRTERHPDRDEQQDHTEDERDDAPHRSGRSSVGGRVRAGRDVGHGRVHDAGHS